MCARAGIRLVHVSTDEVYGDVAEGAVVRRGRSAAPVEPVLRREGRRRPAGARLRAHLRRRRADHARLEHVRPEPVPGEAAAALRHERARRRAAARVRRRRAGARVALRRGPLRRDRAACCAKGRAGEVYNIGGGEEARTVEVTASRARAHRRRRVARAARRGPCRATTAATRSTPRSCATSSAGRRRRASTEGSPRRSAWYAAHREWWEPITVGRVTGSTTRSSTRPGSPAPSRPRRRSFARPPAATA